jgi:hypothetical protein
MRLGTVGGQLLEDAADLTDLLQVPARTQGEGRQLESFGMLATRSQHQATIGIRGFAGWVSLRAPLCKTWMKEKHVANRRVSTYRHTSYYCAAPLCDIESATLRAIEDSHRGPRIDELMYYYFNGEESDRRDQPRLPPTDSSVLVPRMASVSEDVMHN